MNTSNSEQAKLAEAAAPSAPAPAPTPTEAGGTALTTAAEDEAALAALLDAVGDELPYDGFSHSLSPDKFTIPLRSWNGSSGTDVNGVRLTPDRFYDPVTQASSTAIDAIMILEHTKRAYSVFNQDTQEYNTICRSDDCVTGTEVATNKPRKCKGCPDAQWRKTPAGKNAVNCSEEHHVLCVDRATREPFRVIFRRTSADAIKQHIQRHHLGQIKVRGRLANMPLYFRTVRLTLELSDNGKYAIPVIEKTGMTAVADMHLAKETLEAFEDTFTHAFEAGGGGDGGEGGGGVDTSFNPEEFER